VVGRLSKQARKKVSLASGAKLAVVMSIKAFEASPNVSNTFSQTATARKPSPNELLQIYGVLLTWRKAF
jgi:hypothetical protein